MSDQSEVDSAQTQASIAGLEATINILSQSEGNEATIAELQANIESLQNTLPKPIGPKQCTGCNFATHCVTCGNPIGRDGAPLNGKINYLDTKPSGGA